LFNDNLATSGSLAGAILSCHVELSKCNNARRIKNQTEMQRRIHCIASISYSTSGTHQQHWIQHWNEVDASDTSYRYKDNCNRSASTKKKRKKNTTGKHESPINSVQGRADVMKIYYKTIALW